MTRYLIALTDPNAASQIATDPNAHALFEADLVANGVTFDAGEGVTLYTQFVDEDGIVTAGPHAEVYASSGDPSATVLAYDWSYATGAGVDDWKNDMQAFITAGEGVATLEETQRALVGLIKTLRIIAP